MRGHNTARAAIALFGFHKVRSRVASKPHKPVALTYEVLQLLPVFQRLRHRKPEVVRPQAPAMGVAAVSKQMLRRKAAAKRTPAELAQVLGPFDSRHMLEGDLQAGVRFTNMRQGVRHKVRLFVVSVELVA